MTHYGFLSSSQDWKTWRSRIDDSYWGHFRVAYWLFKQTQNKNWKFLDATEIHSAPERLQFSVQINDTKHIFGISPNTTPINDDYPWQLLDRNGVFLKNIEDPPANYENQPEDMLNMSYTLEQFIANL